MSGKSRAQGQQVLSAFLLSVGVVLLIAAGAITLRAWLAPPAHTWSAWSTGAVIALCALAAGAMIAGALVGRRAHRRLHDSVQSFLDPEGRERVAAAIRQFERLTSGEIRVHLAGRIHRDPAEEAARVFGRLGMSLTRDRNAVLFFVSVRSRRLAVIGDTGIHACVPPNFWEGVVRAVESGLARGKHADALIDGIAMVGARLAEHFPPRPGDVNELPDEFSEDAPRDV